MGTRCTTEDSIPPAHGAQGLPGLALCCPGRAKTLHLRRADSGWLGLKGPWRRWREVMTATPRTLRIRRSSACIVSQDASCLLLGHMLSKKAMKPAGYGTPMGLHDATMYNVNSSDASGASLIHRSAQIRAMADALREPPHRTAGPPLRQQPDPRLSYSDGVFIAVVSSRCVEMMGVGSSAETLSQLLHGTQRQRSDWWRR